MVTTLGPESPLPWLEAPEVRLAAADPAGMAQVLAGVAVAVARHEGITLPDLALLSRWGPPRKVVVPSAEASPHLLGQVHQAMVGRVRRRRGGVFYTPAPMAATVARWAIEAGSSASPVVCDPSVGAGSFLLAAGDELVRRGLTPAEVVAHHLVGVDIDPVAAAVCEVALAIWARGAAGPGIEVADALQLPDDRWPGPADVVVGNPPFLNQLGRDTVRGAADSASLRHRFGVVAGGYADTAALFLVLATRMVRPGGAVAMVLPRSFLATRHTGAARRAVLADAALDTLWLPDEGAFDASVRVCVPVLRRGGTDRQVRRFEGTPPRSRSPYRAGTQALASASTWSSLLADGDRSLPTVSLPAEGTLGSWCTATADFRDQYYGMAPFVVDDPGGELDDVSYPPLVTSGLIDPAVCRWGGRPVRYLKRDWAAPRIDLARLQAESGLGHWGGRRLVPKILVATQTRVVEAVVDEQGRWLPSTPVITVTAPAGRLWHAAAVLLAPAVAVWAVRSFGGAALSATAIKLSASQIRLIPTPVDEEAWDEAAAAVREASGATDDEARLAALVRAGHATTRAYGLDDPTLTEWWAARLPVRA